MEKLPTIFPINKLSFNDFGFCKLEGDFSSKFEAFLDHKNLIEFKYQKIRHLKIVELRFQIIGKFIWHEDPNLSLSFWVRSHFILSHHVFFFLLLFPQLLLHFVLYFFLFFHFFVLFCPPILWPSFVLLCFIFFLDLWAFFTRLGPKGCWNSTFIFWLQSIA